MTYLALGLAVVIGVPLLVLALLRVNNGRNERDESVDRAMAVFCAAQERKRALDNIRPLDGFGMRN